MFAESAGKPHFRRHLVTALALEVGAHESSSFVVKERNVPRASQRTLKNETKIETKRNEWNERRNNSAKTLLISTASLKSDPEPNSVLGASSHSVVDMVFVTISSVPGSYISYCRIVHAAFGRAGDMSSTSPCCHLEVPWHQEMGLIDWK